MNSTKKKLFLIITKSNWGGAQRYVYDLATGLSKDNYDITVLMGGEGLLKKKLDDAGFKTIQIPSLIRDISVTSDMKTFFFLLNLFRKERPDIIHVNSSKIGGLGALAGRLTGIKHIVFTLHGLAINEDRSTLSKSFLQAIYWVTIMLSHATIAVSEALRKQSVLLFPLVGKKIYVVHNGIQEPSFLSKEQARLVIAEKCGIQANDFGTPTIGTIGELHHIKGHTYLLDGFAKLLSDLKHINSPLTPKLFIIGEGEERQNLEDQIKGLNLTGQAFLCGSIPEAAQYLKAFDIFTMTSLSEGLAYVVQEAGLATLPVISTNVGGLTEMIEDKKTGILIRSRSANEIYFALKHLLEDPEQLAPLAINLYQKIKTEFSLEQMISKTEEFYN